MLHTIFEAEKTHW